MKRSAIMAIGAAVAAFAFVALPVGPNSAHADTSRSSSTTANAGFFTSDEATGITTSTFVFAGHFTNAFHDPPGSPSDPFSGTGASISIFQCDPRDPADFFDDVCQAFSGFAEIDPSQFVIDGQLTAASLDAMVEVCGFDFDMMFVCFHVHADLDWTGVGSATSSRGINHFRTDGLVSNCRFNQTSRSAEASGTVIDLGTDFTGGATGFGGMSTLQERCTFVD